MMDIVIPEDLSSRLRESLLADEAESCAVLVAGGHRRADGRDRLLVREAILATSNDYLSRGPAHAELAPDFVAKTVKRAKLEGLSVIFVHSHPGSSPPTFSAVDTAGERALADFLRHRHPGRPHAALVLSGGGWNARRLGTHEAARVVEVGSSRTILHDPRSSEYGAPPLFDRQVRAFGEAGQHTLSGLHVAIVGLGGTGSIVAQQLAHLGVGAFTLVDADTLEATNLNRVAGATVEDVGASKVDVAARYIARLHPSTHVEAVQGDIMAARIAERLRDVDIVFGCTDSHGSRAVLQQVAYQYLIPCIDMGTTIVVAAGRVTHVYGRVQLLAPGLGCFTCSGLLDPNEVRRDMMNAYERQADPYFHGAHEPAPAVMSLNGTVSSLAVTMMLAVAVGVPMRGRHLLFNGMVPSLRSVSSSRNPSCFICSSAGALARGDGWPLFARQD